MQAGNARRIVEAHSRCAARHDLAACEANGGARRIGVEGSHIHNAHANRLRNGSPEIESAILLARSGCATLRRFRRSDVGHDTLIDVVT